MNIKQVWQELLNKKWKLDDLFWIAFSIIIASIFTTPLFGIPFGIVVYFLLFYKDDDFDEMVEKYDFKFKNKK